MLFLLILPLTWMLLLWAGKLRRGSRWLIGSLAVIVLATSKPQFVRRNSIVALTALTDTSSSISDTNLKKESEFIRHIEQIRGKNQFRVIPFARSAKDVENIQQIESLGRTHADGSIALATDTEGAIHTAFTTFGNTSAIPNSCFVLVLEKSQSMSSTQMELARLSALEIVENLNSQDLVGVLAFDNVPHWLVPIRTTNERTPTDDRIESIKPGGGTRIAPALGEALRQILSTTALSKHIVLITDGRSRDINTLSLAAEARAQHVTITTVGLVDDVNHGYLTKLARSTRGDSYVIREPWDIEQTLFRDAIAYSSSNFSKAALEPSGNEARSSVITRSAPRNNLGRLRLKTEPQVVASDERGTRFSSGTLTVKPKSLLHASSAIPKTVRCPTTYRKKSGNP
jgi:Mg-chelatase subunit ChlD